MHTCRCMCSIDCAPSHSNSSPLCRPPLPGSGPQLWQAGILSLSLFITLIFISAILIAGQDAGHSLVNVCIGVVHELAYVLSECCCCLHVWVSASVCVCQYGCVPSCPPLQEQPQSSISFLFASMSLSQFIATPSPSLSSPLCHFSSLSLSLSLAGSCTLSFASLHCLSWPASQQ